MKNMIKMSLVAAVAVAGLSTSATAGSLEDAVKDTSIKGKVEVGYNYGKVKTGTAAATQNNEWEYDIDLTFNTKVNDMITAQVGVQADHVIDIDAKQNTNNSAANDITITSLNFTAKTDVATVIVGKQKQPTPFMDDDKGDGVVALVPAGPVTLAAGHFTGMTATTTEDLTAAAVIGTVGPVNASLWYVTTDLTNTTDVSGYSLALDGKVGPVAVDVRHTNLNYDSRTAGVQDVDASLTKIVATADLDMLTVTAGYGMTNDEIAGRAGAGVDLTGDNDAAVNLETEHFALDDLNDADAFLVAVAGKVGSKTTIGAQYFVADDKVNTDYTEFSVNAAYQMSKNFKVSGVIATSEIDVTGFGADTDNDTFELSLKYSF